LFYLVLAINRWDFDSFKQHETTGDVYQSLEALPEAVKEIIDSVNFNASLRNSVNQAGSLWACEYSTSCASEMFKV
jgi:hypothetical protein